MRKLGKILRYIFEFLLIIYVIIITACLLCTNKFGYTQFGDKTIVTISKDNEAEFKESKKGDLVIINQESFNDLNKGDVIYYYDTLNEEYIIKTGTISSKEGEGKSTLFFVEGGTASVTYERVIGELDGSYANLGKVLDILSSRVGFLLVVILPVLLLFIYEVYNMIILLKYGDREIKKEENVKIKKED